MGPTCYVQIAQSPEASTSKLPSAKTIPELPASLRTIKATTLNELPKARADDNENDIYQDMPKLISEPMRKKSLDRPSSSPGKLKLPASDTAIALHEDEAKRLCSETRRMLLSHQEHAMTLTELVECFVGKGDPTNPTVESLYQTLKNSTTTSVTGGDAAAQKKFEVRFP